MLVRSPIRERRQVSKDAYRAGMKDVRTILMNQNARFVVPIIGIPADVRAAIANEHLLAEPRSEALREHAAGESGSHDQVVEHAASSLAAMSVRGDLSSAASTSSFIADQVASH